MVRHNGEVKEPTRQTLIRRSDEPKLEIGDTVPIKEGVAGVVLARFTPSGETRNEVHYIVELTTISGARWGSKHADLPHRCLRCASRGDIVTTKARA